MQFQPEDIARVCHEANRALQQVLGEEDVSPPWGSAPEWQTKSAIEGVVHAIEGASAESLHESWVASKVADGWTYGPEKDGVAKTHPCLVPYADLPHEQKVKDYLFRAVVDVLHPTPSHRDVVNVYEDSSGQWRWHRKAANGMVVSESGESYVTRSGAVQAAARTNPLLPVRSER